MRRQSYIPFVAFSLVSLLIFLYFDRTSIPRVGQRLPIPIHPPSKAPGTDFPPPAELPPLSPVTLDSHPIRKLIDQETARFEHAIKKQSSTLVEAAEEYKRRYQIPPPPNFDKWYSFAKARKVELTDEYDTIYHALLPFWGVSPGVLRARAREALGFAIGEDNFLLPILVRDGKIASKVNGWQHESTAGMMKGFVQYLPDMDLAFNTHDEPRVVVPNDDLSRIVNTAIKKIRAISSSSQKSAFSARPKDLSYNDRVPEIRTTRFNRFAHQATWTHSRLSCPADSPARSLDETALDDTTAYTFSDLSLIGNKTAFTDICNSPSLRQTYGFFDRPNSFDIVHDLFPIFSQSKISSFQDILYPSPWYWANKVPYSELKDMPWPDKISKLYWRGSTTGGFSREGGWRRQHRQQVVRNVNGKDKTRILKRTGGSESSSPKWDLQQAPKPEFAALIDVRFSHVGQCDPGDCAAQEEFFGLAPPAKQEDAFQYKYLLDIDGNAFSGRFYAFLKSWSMPFKMAVFREWHDEWIRPWVHYVPLSLSGHEYVESIRYFEREDEGRVLAREMAKRGREWAGKMLRNEDLEVWFFRLLLEYGRVVDDNRDNIGFVA